MESQSTLTGSMVARAAAADFRSFYVKSAPLKVVVSVENCHIASLRTNNQGSRIAISPDMAADEIKNSDDFFFHLLIICHEIAHLVHRHNFEGPMEPEDIVNTEFWADFYSGKALITLLTYGSRTGSILERFFPMERGSGSMVLSSPKESRKIMPFESVLESIGRSVARLVEKVYTDHPRYPPRVLRAGLISNGITSALRRELINPHPIWYFSVVKRVLLQSQIIIDLSKSNPGDIVVDRAQIERIRIWHRNRQGRDAQLTPGLKFQFSDHLHTRFDHSDEELMMMEEERRSEIQAYYKIDIP